MERFEDLVAWQKARELTTLVYRLSGEGHFSRDFGLRDQIRRAAVSVMSNVAEGFERGGNREFRNFLSIAKGSCGELESQLVVARDQDYISSDEYKTALSAVKHLAKMIWCLMCHLQSSDFRGSKFKS